MEKCKRGHDPSNWWIDSRGWRQCRACQREVWRAEHGVEGDPEKDLRLTTDPDSESKQCRDCGEVKSRDEFYNNSRDRDGKQPYCIPCWKKRYGNSEYIRASHLRRNYGISLEEYNVLLEEQEGRCAICGALPEGERHGVLPVDHCHKSKEVRGLLCGCCNPGLGNFKDSPELLRKAADYLERVG